MIVQDNRHVRRLDLVLSERENTFLFRRLLVEAAAAKMYTNVLHSGPLIGRDQKIVAGRYHVILLVDNVYADTLLKELKEVMPS